MQYSRQYFLKSKLNQNQFRCLGDIRQAQTDGEESSCTRSSMRRIRKSDSLPYLCCGDICMHIWKTVTALCIECVSEFYINFMYCQGLSSRLPVYAASKVESAHDFLRSISVREASECTWRSIFSGNSTLEDRGIARKQRPSSCYCAGANPLKEACCDGLIPVAAWKSGIFKMHYLVFETPSVV
jgi:hypothetical protein